MNRRHSSALLSPTYSAFFGMGRVMLILEGWSSATNNNPLPFERAILIDFAVQNPRSVLGLVSGLAPVLRLHGLEKADLADVFAKRRLENSRERLRGSLTDLLARRLIEEVPPSPAIELSSFALSDQGREVCQAFQGSYATALRDLARTVSSAWHRRSVNDLIALLRKDVPDQSLQALQLSESFGQWMMEPE